MAAMIDEAAFAAPLAEALAGASPDTPSLFWLGQAGFAITCGGRLVLIDPWLSNGGSRYDRPSHRAGGAELRHPAAWGKKRHGILLGSRIMKPRSLWYTVCD